MQDKWIAVLVVGFSVAMFSPLAIMEYSKAQCRIEAIKVHMPAEEIVKVCGK